jgi:hypothetical protein
MQQGVGNRTAGEGLRRLQGRIIRMNSKKDCRLDATYESMNQSGRSIVSVGSGSGDHTATIEVSQDG